MMPADHAQVTADQEGLRFTHLERQRGKTVRRITIALTRAPRNEGYDYYLRADEATASSSLGRRSDRHFTDERLAHKHYERILHRHLARGYRETPTGQGFESWWLFSWGFRPEQIDPDAAPFAAALTAFVDSSIAPRMRYSGWRAYGAAIDRPLRRAFLVVGHDEPRLLDPSLVESSELPKRAYLLARTAQHLGLAPLTLEIGLDIESNLYPFDLHSARGESLKQMPRSERLLLLEQLLTETSRLSSAFDPLSPVEALPWSDALQSGYWAVSADETQTRWVA